MYDGVNRVKDFSEATRMRTYGYNRNGNGWVAANSELPLSGLTPQAESSFDAATNRLTLVSYDGSGNQARVSPYTVTYDGESQQVQAVQDITGYIHTYSYDGEGRRVKAVSNGVTEIYVYDAMGKLAAEYTTQGPASTGTKYVTPDHLGSTRLVTNTNTDPAQIVEERHDYLPFGEELSAGIGPRTTPLKYLDGNAAGVMRQKFTGKERDAETGLDYFGARYYSGAQGRFTSPDIPLADQDPSDPQSWNLYGYGRNNPLRFTDPSGTCSQDSGGYWDADDHGTFLFKGPCANGTIGDNKPSSTTVQDFGPPSDWLLAAALGAQRAGPVINAAAVGTAVVATGLGAGVAYGAIAGGTALTSLGVASGPLVGVGLTPQSKAFAEEMIAAGHKVVALPTNSITKMADFVIDGIVTEYKGLTAAGPTTVKNAIEKAAQQGRDIIIDARRVGLSAANALQQIQRAQGNIGGLQGRVTVLTKEGPVKF